MYRSYATALPPKEISTLSRWLSRPVPRPGRKIRLFCFPHAGGGASAFRDWPADLPPSIEVCAVQLPGRENRITERPFTDLKALVSVLGRSLEPHLALPFAFFGHSMGALVAFELARELRRRRHAAPAHLFVSGRGAPGALGRSQRLHHLPDGRLVARLRRMGGTPAAVLKDTELLRLVLPAFRADLTLCETYEADDEAPLDCPLTAFSGMSDDDADRRALATWGRHVRARFQIRRFSGGHFFLVRAQAPLLKAISDCLAPDLDVGREAGSGPSSR